MEYLLRRAANREGNQAKRKWVGRVGVLKSVLTSDLEMQSLEFAQMVFGLALVQYFFTMFSSLHFRKVMYILHHYMLEVYDLFLILIL